MKARASEVKRSYTPSNPDNWFIEANRVGAMFDMGAIIPLDEESLIATASTQTGLSDFGDEDGWRPHFRVILKALNEEAQLHFFGRAIMRNNLLQYLETRLMVTDAYRKHPEIDDQEVSTPIFIIGMGRSGTTILQELLNLDSEIRGVRKWEGMYPWPAPEEETYETDPRIERAQVHADLYHAYMPDFSSQHQMGGAIPIEDVEFTAPAFLTEMFYMGVNVPTYSAYLAEQGDDLHMYWHKRILKLLQWRFKKPHWVLKAPTYLGRVDKLVETYPYAKFIFTHRDPIVALDSISTIGGSLVGLRSFARRNAGDPSQERANEWGRIIDLIESGTLKPNAYANFIFMDFQEDKLGTIEGVYKKLDIELSDETRNTMKALLDSRPKGAQGNANQYTRSEADSPRAKRERQIFERYQSFFDVPNEL